VEADISVPLHQHSVRRHRNTARMALRTAPAPTPVPMVRTVPMVKATTQLETGEDGVQVVHMLPVPAGSNCVVCVSIGNSTVPIVPLRYPLSRSLTNQRVSSYIQTMYIFPLVSIVPLIGQCII
jgi:hypothetical protein